MSTRSYSAKRGRDVRPSALPCACIKALAATVLLSLVLGAGCLWRLRRVAIATTYNVNSFQRRVSPNKEPRAADRKEASELSHEPRLVSA
jgi:hypothetical protein